MRSLLAVLGLLINSILADFTARCCSGYTINSTSSPYYTTFTQILETDFLHVPSLSDVSASWTPQAYNVTPEASRGPYGKIAQVENVQVNPIVNESDWTGPPDDPGLKLIVRSEKVGDMVPMAEIVSVRDDILYGSFRIGMKGTNVNGTCGAFFFYFNDTQEIDMEVLSKDETTHFVIQAPERAASREIAPMSHEDQEYELAWHLKEGYHEYRFDWMPDSVGFYIDGSRFHTSFDNMTRAAGRLHVSHWSNGNEGWSAGPPQQDAVLTVSYIKAYFNSSDETLNLESKGGCQPCEVPDQHIAPDPNPKDDGLVGGNSAAQTIFFSQDPTGRNDSEASGGQDTGGQTPDKDVGVGRSTNAVLLWSTVLAVIALTI